MAAKPFTLLRWSAFVLVMSAASFVPFSFVSLISVLENWHGVVQYFAFALAGLIQGALIGFGQALAMRKTAVAVPGKKWILASSLGMGALWMIALIPGFFFTPDFSNIVVAIVAALVIIVVVSIFPFVQTRILRFRIRGSWRWIPVTVGSWLIGGLVMALSTLLSRGEDVNIFKAIFFTTIGGTLALLALTLAQGYGLQYLARDAIANPKWGTILPDTPRFNAAKKKIGSVSSRAKTQAKSKASSAASAAKKKATSVASSAKAKATTTRTSSTTPTKKPTAAKAPLKNPAAKAPAKKTAAKAPAKKTAAKAPAKKSPEKKA